MKGDKIRVPINKSFLDGAKILPTAHKNEALQSAISYIRDNGLTEHVRAQRGSSLINFNNVGIAAFKQNNYSGSYEIDNLGLDVININKFTSTSPSSSTSKHHLLHKHKSSDFDLPSL